MCNYVYVCCSSIFNVGRFVSLYSVDVSSCIFYKSQRTLVLLIVPPIICVFSLYVLFKMRPLVGVGVCGRGLSMLCNVGAFVHVRLL